MIAKGYKVIRIILITNLYTICAVAQDVDAEIGGVTFENEEVCLHDVYRQVTQQNILCTEEEVQEKEEQSGMCIDVFWSLFDPEGVIRSPETPKEVQKQFWSNCMGGLECKIVWQRCSDIAQSCYETIETVEYVQQECVKVCEPVATMRWEGGGVQPWKNCRRTDQEFPNCPLEYFAGSGVRNGWWIFGTDSPLMIRSMTDQIPGLWGIDKKQGKIVYYAGDENSNFDADLYLPIKDEGDVELLYICDNPKTCQELMLERGYDPLLCNRETASQ